MTDTSKERCEEVAKRLRAVAEHDWRTSILAHTSDTAADAADLITALCERMTELEGARQFDLDVDSALRRADTAEADLAEAVEVVKKLEAALRKDSRDKSIMIDTVEYHLDGQEMYLAINTARAFLTKHGAQTNG